MNIKLFIQSLDYNEKTVALALLKEWQDTCDRELAEDIILTAEEKAIEKQYERAFAIQKRLNCSLSVAKKAAEKLQ